MSSISASILPRRVTWCCASIHAKKQTKVEVVHCIAEAIIELIETCFWEKSIGSGRLSVNENVL
jgi:hypothetical protein